MHFSVPIFLALVAFAFSVDVNLDYFAQKLPSTCGTFPRIRRSWTTLTEKEQKNYANTVMQMKKYKDVWWSGGPTMPLYDLFVTIHGEIENSKIWHGSSHFLPAHKWFLWMYESGLIYTAYTFRVNLGMTENEACSMTLPYWDWLLDADTNQQDTDWVSERSPIFDLNDMGSTARDKNSKYVVDGVFGTADWKTVASTSADINNPQNKLGGFYDNRLKRQFDRRYNPSITPYDAMYNIVTKGTYADFSVWLEAGPHGYPHMWIGGSMAIMFSPDDPFFFLHHCNIDRLYHLWADCWDYENMSPPTTNQYKANGNGAYDPYTFKYYDVGPDAKLTYYRAYNSDSYVFPFADWPTPNKLWSMGTSTTRGFKGLYYRYGPDTLKDAYGYACYPTFSWVGISASTKKRAVEEEEERKDTHPQLPALKASGEYFREEIAKGRSAEEVLYELATADCENMPKLEITPHLTRWLQMMGQTPSAFDTICKRVTGE